MRYLRLPELFNQKAKMDDARRAKEAEARKQAGREEGERERERERETDTS